MKTYSTRASEIRRQWHVLDATGVPLGRLASQAAALIRGKHKVTYAPNLDTGDYVVVLNAGKVGFTGRKTEQKKYYRHSQYPSGLHIRSLREQLDRDATRVIEHAVHGMLPHNRLGRSLHGHLKVYVGGEHPHEAQVNGPAQPALSQPPKEPRRKKTATARPGTARPGAAAAASSTTASATTATGAAAAIGTSAAHAAGAVAAADAHEEAATDITAETATAENSDQPAATPAAQHEAGSEPSETEETEA